MNNEISKKQRNLAAISGIAELLLFGLALVLQIPPHISDTSEAPNVLVPKMAGVIAFVASRTIAAIRKKRAISYLVVEVLLFSLFSWGLLLRFQGA